LRAGLVGFVELMLDLIRERANLHQQQQQGKKTGGDFRFEFQADPLPMQHSLYPEYRARHTKVCNANPQGPRNVFPDSDFRVIGRYTRLEQIF
jgi:hypothetical protein